MNCSINCEICSKKQRSNNRSTRHRSDVFIVNFEYIWHIVVMYFLLLWIWRVEYFIAFNQNLSMNFRVISRSFVTIKKNPYVITVNNNFKPLPISHQKKLLDVGNDLNWIHKTSKRYQGAPPWSSATLGKYKKLIYLDAQKVHFKRFFGSIFLHLISNELNWVNINSLTW